MTWYVRAHAHAPVERIVYRDKIKEVEVERVVVQKEIVEKPVERIITVEKSVEIPVEKVTHLQTHFARDVRWRVRNGVYECVRMLMYNCVPICIRIYYASRYMQIFVCVNLQTTLHTCTPTHTHVSLTVSLDSFHSCASGISSASPLTYICQHLRTD
jgi:hypothetical protein